MVQESAERAVSRVLEPGETVLWSGRPDVPALLRSQGGASGLPLKLVLIAGLALVAVAAILWPLRDGLPVGRVLGGLVMVVVISVGGAWMTRGASRRWANGLVYGLTDRRLLILEEGGPVEAYLPEDLPEVLELVERSPGIADVVFARTGVFRPRAGRTTPQGQGSFRSRNAWIRSERASKAFKAQPDAEALKKRIEEWVETRQGEADASLEGFVAAATEPEGDRSAAPGEPTAVVSPQPGLRRIDNPKIGLGFDLPAEWSVLVRQRRSASGESAFDLLDWKELEEAEIWNVLKADGPFDLTFELELVDTPRQVLTLKKLIGGVSGLVYRLMGGKVHALNENAVLGEFRGFSVRRRLISRDKEPPSIRGDLVLHDGNRQLVVSATWLEGSELHDQTLDAIIESIRIT